MLKNVLMKGISAFYVGLGMSHRRIYYLLPLLRSQFLSHRRLRKVQVIIYFSEKSCCCIITIRRILTFCNINFYFFLTSELPRFSQTQFLVDGVCLSEAGMLQIKSLSIEQQVTQRKKRTAKRVPSLVPNPQVPVQDKEARFAATIESVVSGTEGKC